MKKLFLLTVLIVAAVSAHAQVKLSLKFSPAVAINRVSEDNDDHFDYSRRGIGMRFSAGPEVNFFLGNNYSLSTGIWYAAKRAGLNARNAATGAEHKEVYNLQYLQLPFLMRLFTNEIGTDMKLYFTMGGTFDIKVAEKPKLTPLNVIQKFSRFDATVLAGSGVEIQMGDNTYLLAGLSYNRGLLNVQSVIRNTDPAGNIYTPFFKYNNDLLMLDLALRF